MTQPPFNTLLGEAIEAWEEARHGVIAEARVFPFDQFDYRPHPRARSVAEMLLHLVEAGEMMVGELTRPDGDFRRVPFEELMAGHLAGLPSDPAPEELPDLLESTLQDGVRRFREAGELQMLQHIRRFDGVIGTRLGWMYHGIAHEYYHRGQLASYARVAGRVPALTQLIHGDAAE